MRAVWLILAAGFRRQWKSWLLLTVLDSAFPRYVASHGYDAIALAAGALLAANALAAVPAMTAARSRPGQLLRTE